MARKTKGGDPAGQKYASTFESFVKRNSAAPEAEGEKIEVDTEKHPRARRKPKRQPG